ncbi:DNA-binding protein [Spirosoma sp. HMF3257]|uniref:DNA-binding protein n=1 Tax=Spirosoma telluris TaxID=2183553 RepID=A0A327NGY0_9BACT|nr:DNA-binding protein [Spirosoma telluris]RAI74053.1 DNA-binding protein [Spirosoma telluris]
MATIQLTLPDQQLSALQTKAESANLTVNELLKQMIETTLSQPSEKERAMAYVLAKNKTLYERLA